MKKRWSYLREQYVRHLKLINNLEYDKTSKKNYKYFNEMSFLANHIQIRNGNCQDVISNITSVNIESNNAPDDDKVNDPENENVDFVITENEIEAYNDDDDDLADNLFVELSDDDKDESVQRNDGYNSNTDLMNSSTQKLIYKHDNKHQSETKPINSLPVVIEEVHPTELRNADQHYSSTDHTDVQNENYQIVSKTAESRCEDVIFGELVTSMLKKMDSPNRKRAKKEILNILLS